MLNREHENEKMLEVMSNLAQVGAWSFDLEKKTGILVRHDQKDI